MPSVSNAHEAAVLLKSRLAARLTNDYPALNEGRGGVRVVLRDDLPGDPAKGSSTIARIDVSDERGSGDWGYPFRDVSLGIEVWSDESSGGTTGQANPTSATTELSQAITEIVQDDYTYFRDTAGLYAADIRTNRQQYEQNDTRNARSISLEFTCKIDPSA